MITRDNILEGADTEPLAKRGAGRLRHLMPSTIEQPWGVGTNVEGIVVRIDAPEGPLWKLVRVFDDPATWSEPGIRNVVPRKFRRDAVRTVPLPDEWELYDLTTDPAEEENLVRSGDHRDVLERLRELLRAERRRAVPSRNVAWPYASV
jgi:hypothetical protein